MVTTLEKFARLETLAWHARFVRRNTASMQAKNQNCSQLYNRARYYDTSTGEFCSRDPLEYVDGMSMMRGYLGILEVDPTGKLAFFLHDFNLVNEKQEPAASYFFDGRYQSDPNTVLLAKLSFVACYQKYKTEFNDSKSWWVKDQFLKCEFMYYEEWFRIGQNGFSDVDEHQKEFDTGFCLLSVNVSIEIGTTDSALVPSGTFGFANKPNWVYNSNGVFAPWSIGTTTNITNGLEFLGDTNTWGFSYRYSQDGKPCCLAQNDEMSWEGVTKLTNLMIQD